MATLGVGIGIVICMVLWRWYDEMHAYRRNLNELERVGHAMHMAFRQCIQCISIGQFPDAWYHLKTAKERWARFRAVNDRTQQLANRLAHQLVTIEKVLQYVQTGKKELARESALLLPLLYSEYHESLELAKESVGMDDDE